MCLKAIRPSAKLSFYKRLETTSKICTPFQECSYQSWIHPKYYRLTMWWGLKFMNMQEFHQILIKSEQVACHLLLLFSFLFCIISYMHLQSCRSRLDFEVWRPDRSSSGGSIKATANHFDLEKYAPSGDQLNHMGITWKETNNQERNFSCSLRVTPKIYSDNKHQPGKLLIWETLPGAPGQIINAVLTLVCFLIQSVSFPLLN